MSCISTLSSYELALEIFSAWVSLAVKLWFSTGLPVRLSSLAFASYRVCVHIECILCSWSSNLGQVRGIVLLVLVLVPCCLLDFVTVSDCMHHQLVLVDWFVSTDALRFLSTSIFVAYKEWFLHVCALPSLQALACVTFLTCCWAVLNSCSSRLTSWRSASGSYSSGTAFACDATCACPFHASCFPSWRCVLCSSCALCSLNYETVSPLLLHLSHFLRLRSCLLLLCFRWILHRLNLVLDLCSLSSSMWNSTSNSVSCSRILSTRFCCSSAALVPCIVDRLLDSAFCFARFSFEFGSQRCLLLLVDLFRINVFELDDLFDVLWHWRCSAPSPWPQVGNPSLLAFSSSAIIAMLISWSSATQSGIVQVFVLGLRRLLGCLGVWYLENLLYHWELHSVLAQLTHKHLSSQQGTVTLFSMYWICVESSHWCSPLWIASARHCDSTAHPPFDMRTATGVPQYSRSSALSLDNHLDVLHYHLLSMETSSAFRVDSLIIIIWRLSSPPWLPRLSVWLNPSCSLL